MWDQQASSLTNTLAMAQYRSVAMQTEVKLREALDRCNEVAGTHLQVRLRYLATQRFDLGSWERTWQARCRPA